MDKIVIMDIVKANISHNVCRTVGSHVYTYIQTNARVCIYMYIVVMSQQ